MKSVRFFRKNWVPLLILLIVAVIVRNYYYAEGFQTCIAKCVSPNTLKNGVCYQPCPSGKVSYTVNGVEKCGNKLRPGETVGADLNNRKKVPDC
jgi:hypothetical protein